jgi:hypothetical protein
VQVVVDDLTERALAIGRAREIVLRVMDENVHAVRRDLSGRERVRSVEGLADLRGRVPDLAFRQPEITESSQDIRFDHGYERHRRPAAFFRLDPVHQRRAVGLFAKPEVHRGHRNGEVTRDFLRVSNGSVNLSTTFCPSVVRFAGRCRRTVSRPAWVERRTRLLTGVIEPKPRT